MKAARVGFLLLLAILIALFSLYRPTRLSRAQSGQTNPPSCCGPAEPHELDFAYYLLRDGFTSTLVLASASPQPFSFTVALHSRSGQALLAPSQSIQPQAKLSINLQALLTTLAGTVTQDFSDGSIAVYFNGTRTMLAGQVAMTNPAQSQLVGIEVVDNSPGLTTVPAALHTLWWGLGSGREALIRVANTSAAAVVADIYLDFQGARHPGTALNFAPFETKVLSVTDLLGGMNLSPAQAPEGGLSIVQRGAVPTLIAQGRTFDAATGFSTPLHFPDLSLHRVSALHASGVPLAVPSADSPYAGTGTYTPHIIARNLTGAPQSITPSLEYPAASGPVQTPLVSLTLAPYATVDIPLTTALTLPPKPIPHAAIGIQYSGAPGSLIAEVASIEQRGQLAVSSYAENAGNNYAGSGTYAWHLDNQTESILYLSNLGGEECPIGMRVQANGVTYYVTDVRLKAHETRALSLRQLRDVQKADFKGNKIPANAMDGTLLWARLKNDPITGQMDVVSNGVLVTPEQSGSCCCPANYQGLSVTPGDPVMTTGDGVQFCATLATMDCNGNYSYSNWTDLSIWSSSNTAVATVSSTTPGFVTAVGTGTSSIIAQWGQKWQQYMCCGNVCNPAAQVPVEGGASVYDCDFTIAPLSVTSSDCTNGTKQSVQFSATVTPSLTDCDWIESSSSCSATASGNVEIAVGSPINNFGNGTPNCTVQYFSGPKQADGTAGTINMTFALKFGTNTVSHTLQAPVTCP